MDSVTPAEIRRFAPGAKNFYVEALVQGWPDLVAAGFNTPLRWCHFMAQMDAETGGFTITTEQTTWSHRRMCELWPDRFKPHDPVFRAKHALACRDGEMKDFNLAEMAYNDGRRLARKLGNREEGDGYNYRGRMFLQPTGRDCYRRIGNAIGVDLEGQPDLLENPRTALRAAIWYWTHHKLHDLADKNYGTAISRAINRGNPHSSKPANGEARRTQAFHRAWAIWGTQAAASVPNEIRRGAVGREVEAVQNQLRDLGYAPGRPDGIFGNDTARALAAFKADWAHNKGEDLEPGDLVGPKTKAALASSEPIQRPEREEMTAEDLREQGSTEVAAGDMVRKVGGGAVLVAVADGAAKAGADDAIKGGLSSLPAYKAMIEPAIDGAKWLLSHWLWAVILIGGIWLYYGGHKVVMARLNAARKGINLWR